MRVVVLGGGIAGYTAAQTIRKADSAVRVTVVSAEPERTYSACVLAEYIAGEIGREQVFIRSREDAPFDEGQWMTGCRVAGIDLEERTVNLDRGGMLEFDRLVVATGAGPVVPGLPGIRREGVCCLKTLGDADRIFRAMGREAVVVGAGPVGLEAAAALRKRGWEVSVVEVLDRVLGRLFGTVHADMIRELLEDHGIRVFTGERVMEVAGEGRVEAVITDRRALSCQLVVLGIGMQPEVTLAEGAGIRLGASGGILVDEGMRTSHEDVFACGDCVESLDRLTGERGLNLLWGNAKVQGAVAGANSLGLEKKYRGALNVTTVRLFDTMAVSAGRVDLARQTHRELFQRQGQRSATRLVLEDGLIRGMQAVGRRVDASVFLNMMLCGEGLYALRDAPDKRTILGMKPWLVRLPAFLRSAV